MRGELLHVSEPGRFASDRPGLKASQKRMALVAIVVSRAASARWMKWLLGAAAELPVGSHSACELHLACVALLPE